MFSYPSAILSHCFEVMAMRNDCRFYLTIALFTFVYRDSLLCMSLLKLEIQPRLSLEQPKPSETIPKRRFPHKDSTSNSALKDKSKKSWDFVVISHGISSILPQI